MFDTLFRGVTYAAQDNKWYGMYARHVNNGHNQNFFQEIMDACAPTPRSKAHDAPAAATPQRERQRYGDMASLHAAAKSRVSVAHRTPTWRPKVIVAHHINWDDVDYIITNIQKCSQPELREYRDIIDNLIDLYDDYGHPYNTMIDDLQAFGFKRNLIAYNLYERNGMQPPPPRPELGIRLIKAGYVQASDSSNVRIHVYRPHLFKTERLYVYFFKGNVTLRTQLRDIEKSRTPPPRSTVHQQASFYLLFKGGNVPAS